eukprot:TRINITY_DN9692_c0_g2_i1.p1 TRINITY_DN9692_c0_g2~~TRINITY_DN9692_c0_g2_i1.p1  ORF type:complete len:227 (+),score=74.71 TRINITY_DN9692_c0_g2_i1:117-797(+)
MTASTSDVSNLLRSFLQLHEKRVATYGELHNGFKTYLFAMAIHVERYLMLEDDHDQCKHAHGHAHARGHVHPTPTSEEKPKVLQKRWEDDYSALLTKVTTEFASISNSIKSIQQALQSLQREDLSNVIQTIQNYEKEKLQTTVQYQVKKKEFELYRITREANEKREEREGSEQEAGASDEHWKDQQRKADFDKYTKEYSQQQDRLIAGINEAIEELRYEMLEGETE